VSRAKPGLPRSTKPTPQRSARSRVHMPEERIVQAVPEAVPRSRREHRAHEEVGHSGSGGSRAQRQGPGPGYVALSGLASHVSQEGGACAAFFSCSQRRRCAISVASRAFQPDTSRFTESFAPLFGGAAVRKTARGLPSGSKGGRKSLKLTQSLTHTRN
jgi:hypothetical protein